MPRLAARKDNNHDEIADAFARIGWHVCDTSQLGNGFPDLVIARPWVAVLVEIKGPGGRLTRAERAFHQVYPGPLEVVRTLEDVVRVDARWRGV